MNFQLRNFFFFLKEIKAVALDIHPKAEKVVRIIPGYIAFCFLATMIKGA